jgi:hypothetical protein
MPLAFPHRNARHATLPVFIRPNIYGQIAITLTTEPSRGLPLPYRLGTNFALNSQVTLFRSGLSLRKASCSIEGGIPP